MPPSALRRPGRRVCPDSKSEYAQTAFLGARRDVFPIGGARSARLPARLRVAGSVGPAPPDHVAMPPTDAVGWMPSQRRSETGDGSPRPVTEKISGAPRAIG